MHVFHLYDEACLLKKRVHCVCYRSVLLTSLSVARREGLQFGVIQGGYALALLGTFLGVMTVTYGFSLGAGLTAAAASLLASALLSECVASRLSHVS